MGASFTARGAREGRCEVFSPDFQPDGGIPGEPATHPLLASCVRGPSSWLDQGQLVRIRKIFLKFSGGHNILPIRCECLGNVWVGEPKRFHVEALNEKWIVGHR